MKYIFAFAVPNLKMQKSMGVCELVIRGSKQTNKKRQILTFPFASQIEDGKGK